MYAGHVETCYNMPRSYSTSLILCLDPASGYPGSGNVVNPDPRGECTVRTTAFACLKGVSWVACFVVPLRAGLLRATDFVAQVYGTLKIV